MQTLPLSCCVTVGACPPQSLVCTMGLIHTPALGPRTLQYRGQWSQFEPLPGLTPETHDSMLGEHGLCAVPRASNAESQGPDR